MKTVGVDAARVSDESGKGVELLRQQSWHSEADSERNALLVAEVDSIIRYVRVSNSGDSTISAGTFDLVRRGPGGALGGVLVSNYNFAHSGQALASDDYVDIPLAETRVSKDELVIAVFAGVGTNYRSVHLGWMPSLWRLDTETKTY